MDRPDPAPDQARDRGRGARALVAHESMFGNTRLVADAVAHGLERAGVSTDVVDVAEAGAVGPTVPDYDVLVVGAPTHAFSPSRASSRAQAIEQGAPLDHEERGMREWLAEVPEPPPGAHHAATFDTRVTTVRHLPGSAAVKAARILRRHHYLVEDAPRSFYVEDLQGPLVAGEVDRAEEWGAELGAAQVARGRSPRA
ncbi:flavodoxin family protein [Nocardioides kribbensis]|uniref:Flavodoxin-like domain-containing protein n=1 Tax=Nocardioides kribbensis TaxID=305517 RepID=A0ABV1NW12_9ACTN